MNLLIKIKKHFLSFLLFSIALFICCSVVASIFHNDDKKHEIHPLNHSPVCQWINEGKLFNRNTATDLSLASMTFMSFFTIFCIFTACFLLSVKNKEKNLPINRFFLGSALFTRAPPAKQSL
jgi:hypothetical protein